MSTRSEQQYKTMMPKTGKTVKSDGSIVNEADYIGRIYNGLTAFDETRVASTNTQIDIKSIYPLSRIRDRVISESGDGNVEQKNGYFEVFTTTDAASDVTFQTIERGRYVSGEDALAGLGLAAPVTPVGNQEIEWGYTDFINGFVTGVDSTNTYIAFYNKGVRSQKIYRDAWTGQLQKNTWTFDVNKMNVYRTPFRWYGKGPFELQMLGLDIDGKGVMYFADAMPDQSGDTEFPLTANPNLPISVRIKNNGTAGNPLYVNVAGRHFSVIGSYNPDRRTSSEFRINQSISNEFTPLIAFKQRDDIDGYNFVTTILSGFDLITSDNIIYQIRLFSDVSGDAEAGSFVSPEQTDNGTESSLLFNTSLTDVITDGIKVYEGLATGGQGNSVGSKSEDLPRFEMPTDQDLVVLCARSIGASSTVTSCFRVLEEW